MPSLSKIIMNPQVLDQAVSIVSTHGYWFIFLVMIIEGPIVTTAAAFASALGFFNVYIIFALSILADTVGDVLYYAIGYWGRLRIVERYGKQIGFGESRVRKIGDLLHRNFFAAIATIKMSPGVAPLGLIIVGASKIPLKKYVKICLYITSPRALTFVILGYYAGRANVIADRYLHHSQYWLTLAPIAIIIGSYLYKKISNSIASNIEKI